MSWAKEIREASDAANENWSRSCRSLDIERGERRISLGLKQARRPLGGVAQKTSRAQRSSGPVTSLTKFGAFVQLTEGVEGMIHVSEISAEKRINHPQEVLRGRCKAVVARRSRLDLKTAHTPEHETAGSNRPGRIPRRT